MRAAQPRHNAPDDGSTRCLDPAASSSAPITPVAGAVVMTGHRQADTAPGRLIPNAANEGVGKDLGEA